MDRCTSCSSSLSLVCVHPPSCSFIPRLAHACPVLLVHPQSCSCFPHLALASPVLLVHPPSPVLLSASPVSLVVSPVSVCASPLTCARASCLPHASLSHTHSVPLFSLCTPLCALCSAFPLTPSPSSTLTAVLRTDHSTGAMLVRQKEGGQGLTCTCLCSCGLCAHLYLFTGWPWGWTRVWENPWVSGHGCHRYGYGSGFWYTAAYHVPLPRYHGY
jgi:hypothetical protein